jgi:hypothetical protein
MLVLAGFRCSPAEGDNAMRKRTCLAAAILLCNIMPAAQAQGTNTTALLKRQPPQAIERPMSEVRASLTQTTPAVSRDQIAVCANLAAIRALGAKAAGADYPSQSRILDLTFVLCLAGTPTRD